MIICGIKLTHDGGVALIDHGKLIFSYEMEKLNNNPRYSDIKDFSVVHNILKENGYTSKQVDRFVIDGWGDSGKPSNKPFKIKVKSGKDDMILEVAKYGHLVVKQDVLIPQTFNYPTYNLKYNSYMHVTGHILGAYCTSPFPQKQESSFVLVWDGGMCPQLFYFDYGSGKVKNLRPLFLLNGNAYCAFAQNFEPFAKTHKLDMSVGGKVMAYIALGKVVENILDEFKYIYESQLDKSVEITDQLIKKFVNHGENKGYKSADMIATFHVFIEELIVDLLRQRISDYPEYTQNLCFSGGCALNIKWNSAIRSSGIFKEMWVPPFPNDSGSAIGTACCEMVNATGAKSLEWSVYSGPLLKESAKDSLWEKYPFSVKDLAKLIHTTNDPIVILNNRAELGPRALGNRSIVAAATGSSMKELLNKLKKRESYRPVAPICLEEDAPEIFDPGIPDPLMLYDHSVKDSWKKRIPAICHLDDTARLQTINQKDNPEIYELLTEYKKLTGIPVLCNTSANFNGKGFFPDVLSAMQWGRTPFIWNSDFLYVIKGYNKFLSISEKYKDKENTITIKGIEV